MKTIRVYKNVPASGVVVKLPLDATYLVACDGTATATVEVTMNPYVQGKLFAGTEITFSAIDSTITRKTDSFVADDFEVGMTITVSGSASNDGVYTITAVSSKTITVSGALTDEVTSAATIVGDIQDGEWFTHASIASSSHVMEFLENGPTGIRIKNTAGVGVVDAWVKS